MMSAGWLPRKGHCAVQWAGLAWHQPTSVTSRILPAAPHAWAVRAFLRKKKSLTDGMNQLRDIPCALHNQVNVGILLLLPERESVQLWGVVSMIVNVAYSETSLKHYVRPRVPRHNKSAGGRVTFAYMFIVPLHCISILEIVVD